MVSRNKFINIMLGFCFFIVSIFLCKDNVYVLFLVDMFLLFLIVYKAQFSLITIWAIVPNYTLMCVFYYYVTDIAYGKLAFIHNLQYNKFCELLILYNCVLVLFTYFSSFLDYEKEIYEKDVKIDNISANICALLAVVMAYISFPSFNFAFDNNNRFNALLPGHFWNHFSVILLIFSVGNLKKSRLVRICYCVVIMWFLLHSERVDILGLILFLLIRYCSKKKYQFSLKTMSIVSCVCIAIFLLFIYIGNIRAGEQFVVSTSGFMQSFFTQSTASDLGHVFNGTLEYVDQKGLLYGKTYITYLQGIIPMLEQPLRAGHIIESYYHTAGGEFILTEPYLNFGFLGIVIIIPIYVCMVLKIIRKNSMYNRIVFYFLTVAAIRYLWYGLTYIETGIIYLIPLTYFGVIFLEKGKYKK